MICPARQLMCNKERMHHPFPQRRSIGRLSVTFLLHLVNLKIRERVCFGRVRGGMLGGMKVCVWVGGCLLQAFERRLSRSHVTVSV